MKKYKQGKTFSRKITLLLFFYFLFQNTNSQKLHAYLFCHTNDKSIGKGVENDFHKMIELCRQIAGGMNLQLVDHSLTGANYNYVQFTKVIDSIPILVQKKDVVVLYFSTHGIKSSKDKDNFPRVLVPNPDKYISSFEVFNEIAKTKPKTLLTLIDACSEYLRLSPQDSFLLSTSLEQPKIEDKESDISSVENLNYLHLFDNCLQIFMAAGEPGKITYTTSQGSFFTTSFITALNETTSQKEGLFVWKKILEQTKQYTFSKTKGKPSEYSPIWEVKHCGDHTWISSPTEDLKVGSITHSFGNGLDIISSKAKRKAKNKKTIYDVILRIASEDPMDSARIYLDHTMDHPIVVLKAVDSLNKFIDDRGNLTPEIRTDPDISGQLVKYSFTTDHEFSIKVKVYCKTGNKFESYGRIEFPDKENREKPILKLNALFKIAFLFLAVFIFFRIILKIKSKAAR